MGWVPAVQMPCVERIGTAVRGPQFLIRAIHPPAGLMEANECPGLTLPLPLFLLCGLQFLKDRRNCRIGLEHRRLEGCVECLFGLHDLRVVFHCLPGRFYLLPFFRGQ